MAETFADHFLSKVTDLSRRRKTTPTVDPVERLKKSLKLWFPQGLPEFRLREIAEEE